MIVLELQGRKERGQWKEMGKEQRMEKGERGPGLIRRTEFMNVERKIDAIVAFSGNGAKNLMRWTASVPVAQVIIG